MQNKISFYAMVSKYTSYVGMNLTVFLSIYNISQQNSMKMFIRMGTFSDSQSLDKDQLLYVMLPSMDYFTKYVNGIRGNYY